MDGSSCPFSRTAVPCFRVFCVHDLVSSPGNFETNAYSPLTTCWNCHFVAENSSTCSGFKFAVLVILKWIYKYEGCSLLQVKANHSV